MQPKWIGQSNPLDELPDHIGEPTVLMADGTWKTRDEMIAVFNSLLAREQLQINVHENGELHLWMPFENAKEFVFGMEDE